MKKIKLNQCWEKIPIFLIFFFLFFDFLILSFFHPLNGDEGIYLYQSKLISEGVIPIRDFFASNPIGFYIPYSIIFCFFKPSIEAARLLSVIVVTISCYFLFSIIRRDLGIKYALLGILTFSLNIHYLQRNLIVKHYVISNFGLITATFLLTYKKTNWKLLTLCGLALGISVNSRIITSVVVIPVLLILIRRCLGWDFSNLSIKYVISSFFGGFIVGISPSVLLLIENPKNFIFSMLLWRLIPAIRSNLSGDYLWRFSNPLISRLNAIFSYTFYSFQNFLLIFLLVFIFLFYTLRYVKGKPVSIYRSQTVASSIGLAILIGYFLSDVVVNEYLNQITPYISLIVCYGIASLNENLILSKATNSIRKSQSIFSIIMLFFFTFYLYFGYDFAINIITNRREYGIRQIQTVNKLACWLSINSTRDTPILSWIATPVFVSGNKLPTGFEQANHSATFFWGALDENELKSIHVISPEEMRESIKNEEIAIILDDEYSVAPVKNGFDDYYSLLTNHYNLINEFGGYKIFVRKKQVVKDITRIIQSTPESLLFDIRESISHLSFRSSNQGNICKESWKNN